MKTHVEHTGASQRSPCGRSRITNPSNVIRPMGCSTLCRSSRRRSMHPPTWPIARKAFVTAASPANTSIKSRFRSGSLPPWAARPKPLITSSWRIFSAVPGNWPKRARTSAAPSALGCGFSAAADHISLLRKPYVIVSRPKPMQMSPPRFPAGAALALAGT